MTDDMKLTVYASRDLSEAYGEMAQNLVDTVARGAFETLPADARKTLNDYDGGTETPAVYIVRARDSEGVVDLAVKFVGRRAGVCFWDELEPEEQAAPYFSMGIDYETRIEPKPDEAAPRSGADSAPRAEALMTAEIVLTDHDLVFAFGGPVDQAEAMSAALAERLSLEPAGAGSRLRVAMSRAEMVPLTTWIKDTFPQIGSLPGRCPCGR